MRIILLVILLISLYQFSNAQSDTLLLKDYRPVPYHKIPKTSVAKPKFKLIDMHSHAYASSEEDLEYWVDVMEEKGITKTVILTFQTGEAFDSLFSVYSKYDQFELWCGIDFTGYEKPNWSKSAIKELERCKKVGAKGIGELGDKGNGLIYSKPTPGNGIHLNNPEMIKVLQACGKLNMPVNVHVAEPYWMYLPNDKYNDGLMNGATWKVDLSDSTTLDHGELISTLEDAVRQCPKTTIIACHFANCTYDLSVIGHLLDTYPNLYADISARYGESSTVPRYTKKFIETYNDKLLYGTDMGFQPSMYEITFRILESQDEHFYEIDLFQYHWTLNGLDLTEETLKKLYYENAISILR